MARLMYHLAVILMAVTAVSEAKRNKACGGRMGFRGENCRTSFMVFKRLLDDLETDELAGDEDERGRLAVGDPEADLRALLYGQDTEDDPASTEKRTDDTTNGEDESYEKRKLEIEKYELEMDLVEALLRDLENFNLEQ